MGKGGFRISNDTRNITYGRLFGAAYPPRSKLLRPPPPTPAQPHPPMQTVPPPTPAHALLRRVPRNLLGVNLALDGGLLPQVERPVGRAQLGDVLVAVQAPVRTHPPMQILVCPVQIHSPVP